MVAKTLIVTLVILSFSFNTLEGNVINSTWIGSDSSLWSDRSSWNPSIKPANNSTDSFFVTISTIERTRIVFTENITISRLDCYGNIDLEVGEYRLQIVDINDLSKKGTLNNYGTLQISGVGVEHEIYANIVNTDDAEILVSNEINVYGAFNNLGTILVLPSGHLFCNDSFVNSGNVQIYNALLECPDNNFENNDTGIIQGSGMIHTNLSILNHGKIQAKGGSFVLNSFTSLINNGVLENTPLSSLHIQTVEDVKNFGTIDVNAGGVAFDCNLVNEPNATIMLLNGTLAAKTITQKAGAILKGFGGITSDIMIEPNALVKLIGPTNIVGNMTIGEGAMLDISNGTVLVTGDLTCDNGIIQTTNGTIIILGETKGICQRKFIDTDEPNAVDLTSTQ
jgi:hypothetical protein